jgi:glycosyltransferase involved in cell wall biosynthesis
MKVSGFTIIRNAIKYDFPVTESIKSILPLVDEFIVNIGKSSDETLELIKSLNEPKINIIEAIWDKDMNKDGLVFSFQTNYGLKACSGDWAFYIQADEVIHENDYEKILRAMHDNLGKRDVLGLMFNFYHFWGDYITLNPWTYRKEIRIIRNNGEVKSYGDACGFARRDDNKGIKKSLWPRLWRHTDAYVYHYGWVKRPDVLQAKKRWQILQHSGGVIPKTEECFFTKSEFDFLEEYRAMKKFKGTHPNVMQERIRLIPPLTETKSRWFAKSFYKKLLKAGLKGL